VSATLPEDAAETLRALHARLPVARAEARAIRDAARGALVAELERLHASPPDGLGVPYAAMARALGISGQALHDLRTGRSRP
jgi:hypothetical protein